MNDNDKKLRILDAGLNVLAGVYREKMDKYDQMLTAAKTEQEAALAIQLANLTTAEYRRNTDELRALQMKYMTPE